jgi:hypothetical protein
MDLVHYRELERLIMALMVPMLTYIGYKLFVLGVTGKMQITAGFSKQWTAKLTSVAPGTICFLLATVLAVFILKEHLHQFQVPPTTEPEATSSGTTRSPSSPVTPQKTATTSTDVAAKRPKSLDAAANGATVIDFAGGEPGYALSVRLQKGLSEYCPAAQDQVRTCSTEFYEHFNLQPSNEDLAHIVEVEKRAHGKDLAARAELQELTQKYLRQ